MTRRVLAVLYASAAGVIACGSSPVFDGRTYRDQRVAFELQEVPNGYRRVDGAAGTLAFRDEPNNGSVILSGRCSANEDVPLTALANHLLSGLTDREYVKEETVPFDGREALHAVIKAKLDGVAVTTSIWVLKKNGCAYELVYAAPPARFDAGEASFAKLVAGFRSLGGAPAPEGPR